MSTDPTASASTPVTDAAAAAAGDSEAATPPAPARLLLVDDEPGLRAAVTAYLEDEGFAVTTANDGEEGWQKAQELLPDVVISDVMMPRCDGYSKSCGPMNAWAARR
jgi:PleD family two-component response regulator